MSQTSPKITVLIPTFNRENYLLQCLDSILAQTLQPYQIIVVNDGSSDNTREAIKPYLPQIDYTEIEHQGKSAAMNCGLEMTKGDYLWIFDDDDVALPDALERFVTPLEEYPEYDFSFSTFYFTQSNAEDHSIGKIINEFTIPDLETRGPLIPLLEASYLCGAGLFARSSCYDKVGNFDPALIRTQDYEMAIRLTRHFRGIQVQGGPTFHYRQHQGLRGALTDRFQSDQIFRKWLQYDQITFKRLYKELTLDEYLPPGYSLANHQRQALLQRMAIMAGKLLIPEVTSDLDELKLLNDNRPFTKHEREIIAKLVVTTPWYREGKLFDSLSFQTGLNSVLFTDQDRMLEITEQISQMVQENKVQSKIELLECMLSFSEPKDIFDLMLSLIHNKEKGLFVS